MSVASKLAGTHPVVLHIPLYNLRNPEKALEKRLSSQTLMTDR